LNDADGVAVLVHQRAAAVARIDVGVDLEYGAVEQGDVVDIHLGQSPDAIVVLPGV